MERPMRSGLLAGACGVLFALGACEDRKDGDSKPPPVTRTVPAPIAAVSPVSSCKASNSVAHVAIVTDRSDSIDHGDGAACNAVRTMVDEVLRCRGPFSNLPLARGATQLKIYGTADTSAPGQPLDLVGTLEVPGPSIAEKPKEPFTTDARRKQLEEERRKEELKQHETQIAQIVQQVAAGCKTGPQNTSPIYSAVQAAVLWLHDRVEASNTEGLLVIQSDLDESFEIAIRDARKKVPRLLPSYGARVEWH